MARLDVLKSFCDKVSFACASRPGSSQGRIAATGVECFRVVLNDDASVLAALEAARQPSVVVFDGYNAEERFSRVVRSALPGALRVLDMQDFHALRTGREALLLEGASSQDIAAYRPSATEESLQRELASILRCDATLAISEFERSLLVDKYGVPGYKVCPASINESTRCSSATGAIGQIVTALAG